MFLTVGIPTYEMHPYGAEFVDFSLDILSRQSFKDFEVLVSDHSKDDSIQNAVSRWKGILNINYLKKEYKIDNPSSNLNNIFQNARGEYIKIIFQDDFLFDNQSLEKTVEKIKSTDFPAWLVSPSEHSEDGHTMIRPFYPHYNNDIHIGNNTISSPSVLAIKNDANKVYFNENFKWLMDCIYYKDCFTKFGNPVIIDDITVVNRWWGNQLTNQLGDKARNDEVIMAIKLYDSPSRLISYKLGNLYKKLRKKIKNAITS
ncbi:glycosyltransferase family 2 protein [Mucilaginibacter antarcticus]|uniref:Glycosyltransferase family 2 protein n=1 Tax=Mucilaginibacter antarcticus TaxID=1855725 RepID=A0ABW5XND5_9SPHI